MSTVPTTAPARRTHGSVAYYADLIGGAYPSDSLILTLVDDVANDRIHDVTGEDRLANIRNLLAAAKQVRAEMAAR